jgi:catechol 2,3-dioxygenase-like lactoylglutathione lyase family enzyme
MTLRGHVNRLAELTVNVSDLEASVRFYESATPLRVYRRTHAEPQPFPAFGIDRGEFTGALLADGTSSLPGLMVHLVQWIDPKPVGQTYPTFFNRGLYRMCILTNDLHARHASALAHGHVPFQPPHGHGVPVPGGTEGLSFVYPDPDGIAVQTTARPSPWRADLPDQLYHVNIVSSDIDASRAFLQGIGLDYVKRLTLPRPVSPIGFGRGADVGQFDAVFLWHRGDQRFSIDIVDWNVPGVQGEPYESPLNLGIQRLAFEVDDIDEAVAALRAQLPAGLRERVHDPETWQLGNGITRTAAQFSGPDGIGYELIAQPPYTGARATPWPAEAFE